MGLRDFFRDIRQKKFSSKPSAENPNGMKDSEISANWVSCKKCGATVHKSIYESKLNVCPECGFHGRMSVSARIDSLSDKGTFSETWSELEAGDPLNFNDGKPYKETYAKAKAKTGFKEAISTGEAEIEGIKVAIAVMNFEFLGGSMGTIVGEKLTRLIEHACKNALPVICVSSSGGARMHEGILSLMQMAKTSIALSRLSEAGLPFISLLTDPTYGGVSASFATLGDIIIAEPKSRIGFAGRRVIEETVREKLPADFQSAEYLLEHGQLDMIVERSELKAKIAQILRIHGFFPSNFKVEDYARANLSSEKINNQPKKSIPLEFEKPLISIQDQITAIEKRVSNNEDQNALDKLKEQYKEVEAQIFSSLEPIDITKISRHPNRPNIEDYLNIIVGPDKWIELHGDRAGTDDNAILCALVELEGETFMAVGTRKGRNIKDNQKRNFGMPNPEGYRKAKRCFEHANRFGLPIVTFIDTPGAYPGLNAEANGQSIAIAENLKAMAGLKVPVLAIVTGEGGSGGALAIGVANRVIMLENSVYSVISPEGCAAILWRTRDKAPEAAKALKITAKDLQELGIADEIIGEPTGGAHKDWQQMGEKIQEVILRNLRELSKQGQEKILETRMQKYYSLGINLVSKT